MNLYFSPSTRWFYDYSQRYMNCGTWPDDAIQISEKEQAVLREALTQRCNIALIDGEWRITPRTIPAAELWAPHAAAARDALDASDRVVLRCSEACMLVPDDWREYRAKLREIASAKSGEIEALPAAPPFPSGS